MRGIKTFLRALGIAASATLAGTAIGLVFFVISLGFGGLVAAVRFIEIVEIVGPYAALGVALWAFGHFLFRAAGG
jgi:hypothetical protein